MFMFWLVLAKNFNLLSFQSPACIRDNFFAYTKEMNLYLADNPFLLKCMIVATSWNIDALIFSFGFVFVFYYRSWRLCFWALMFYITRSIIQVIYCSLFCFLISNLALFRNENSIRLPLEKSRSPLNFCTVQHRRFLL